MHERMRPVKDGLLNGRAKSHDAYLEATGFCKGVHEVLDAPAKVKTLVLNQQQQRQELEEDVEVIRPDDWA